MRFACLDHIIPLDFITLKYLVKYNYEDSHYVFCHPPVTSSLLGPNILTSLFSDTPNLCPSLRARDQAPHP